MCKIFMQSSNKTTEKLKVENLYNSNNIALTNIANQVRIMLKKGKATKQNENDFEIENILIRGNLSEKELKNMDLSTLRSMSKDHYSQLTYQLLDFLMNNL
ncbi:hypothetical protein PMLGA01_120010100 [Plasmodium malariae]|uniref:Uncharacterized protein n=1 Tax=Plasmodium malariae TaxID=5858 RepID=A0A1C3L087_PLAMA|nr:hypothetical protein PMLGA01_120010100 [Plasmodium malariae]